MTFPDMLLQAVWSFLSVFVTRGIFLFAVVYLVNRTVAGVPARTRHVMWFAVLCSLLLLPAVRTIIPSVAVQGTGAHQVESAAGVFLAPFSFSARIESALTAWAPEVGVTLDAPRLFPVLLGLVVVYLGGVLYCGVRALSGALVLGALLARTPSSVRLERVANALSGRLGILNRVSVLLDPKVVVPFTCGVRHARIVVPASAESWPFRRIRAVLVHELWHVKRRDALYNHLSYALCSLLWFFPPAWIARRFMRRDAEICCDRRVLADGIKGTEYASAILHVVAARRGAPLRGTQALLGSRAWIAERIARILRPPKEVSRRAAAVVACLLVLLLGSMVSFREAKKPAAGPLRVLFVGDTLGTYWDAAASIAGISGSLSKTRVAEVRVSNVGFTGLRAHVSAAAATLSCFPDDPSLSGLTLIRQGGWDVVVLQDSPWEPLAEHYEFLSSVTTLATEARRIGAEVILLEPFAPDRGSVVFSGEAGRFGGNPRAMQDRLRRASKEVARRLGIRQARVGDAFEWMTAHAPGVDLYEKDKLHPSRRGAFLLSCVVAAALTGQDARESCWLPREGITPAEADVLRSAAAAVASVTD